MAFVIKNKKLILSLLIFVLLIYLCSKYIVQVILIQGDSMSPYYHDKSFAIINRTVQDYKYGDVVAFEVENISGVVVKRIAALPGDRVVIKENNMYVNGILSEVYKHTFFKNPGCLADEVLLQENEFFVIGDNIDKSRDSRFEEIGVVNYSQLIGRIIPHKEYKKE